jgi:hypothetical protein
MIIRKLLVSLTGDVPPIASKAIMLHISGTPLAHDSKSERFRPSLENPKKRGQRWGWPIGSSSDDYKRNA